MAESTDLPGVLRPLKAMSSNVNGLMAEEETRTVGLKTNAGRTYGAHWSATTCSYWGCRSITVKHMKKWTATAGD